MSNPIDIPVVELEEFVFSPPGAMGWSDTEYQRVLEQEPDASMTNFSNLYNIRKDSKHLNVLPPVGEIDLDDTDPTYTENTQQDNATAYEPKLGDVQLVEEDGETEVVKEYEVPEVTKEEQDEVFEPEREMEVVLNYKLRVRKLTTTPFLHNNKKVKQSKFPVRG